MAGLANSSSALQQWHALFQARGGQTSPQAQEHLKQVKLLGLPSRKDEDWKYTSLDKLLTSTFVAPALPALTAADRDAHALALDAWRLVFVDGQFESHGPAQTITPPAARCSSSAWSCSRVMSAGSTRSA